MSTERRDSRSAPATATGRQSVRIGSRPAHCSDRAFPSEPPDIHWIFPVSASERERPRARTAQLDDYLHQQAGQRLCHGSPPFGPAAGHRSLFDRSIGNPLRTLSAVFAPIHPSLPQDPAAMRRRTERYDGKGNMYLQHAA